jgi:hypothetical protein
MGPYGTRNYSRPSNSTSDRMNYAAEADLWYEGFKKASKKFESTPSSAAAPFQTLSVVVSIIMALTVAVLTILEAIIKGVFNLILEASRRRHERRMARIENNHERVLPKEEMDFFNELTKNIDTDNDPHKNIFG